jgi:hypothetical protein
MVPREQWAVMKWKGPLALALLACLGILGTVGILHATAPGAGISPDSTQYIGAARNLLAGRGLTTFRWFEAGWVPLTHFPPLFPVALALGGLFGPDPAVVARWLNAFLMGANVFLLGYSLHRTTGGAVWTPVLGSVLALTSVNLVEVHTWAWSEPLMLLCGFAGLLGLCLWLEEGGWWRLVVAGGWLALALLARYAALPFIVAAGLGLLLFRQGRFVARLREASLLLLVSGGPLGLWLLHNRWAAGVPTDRAFVTHWITAKRLLEGRATCAGWFCWGARKLTPTFQATILWVALGVLLLLVAALAWKTWRPDKDAEGRPRVPRLPWVLLLFILTYPAFLVVSISFFDFATPLDNRLLCPLYFALVTFALGVMHAVCASHRWLRWSGVGWLALGGWFAWTHAGDLRKKLDNYHATGRGFASPRWRECRFFERIRDMPDVPIYVNVIGVVDFYTGRFVRCVPLRRDALSNRPNLNFEAQMQRMKDDLANRHGVFIELRGGGWYHGFPPRAEFFKEVGLQSVEKTPDAEVFAIPPPAPPEPEAEAKPPAEPPAAP